MPQADLSHSGDIMFDAPALLGEMEVLIRDHDSAAGQTKARVHKIDVTHHQHVLLRLAVLEKPHRDAAYMAELSAKLHALLATYITQPCEIGIEISFLSPFYFVNTIEA